MPFNLGLPELLVIGGIALLIFGPRSLPKLGRSVGDAIREFRSAGKALIDDEKEGD